MFGILHFHTHQLNSELFSRFPSLFSGLSGELQLVVGGGAERGDLQQKVYLWNFPSEASFKL